MALGSALAACSCLALAAPANAAGAAPQVLWGMGDEISAAQQTPLYRTGDVNLVTAWYNGPGDLGWISGYGSGTTMSDLYGQGKGVELVVYLPQDSGSYATGDQFQTDIKSLVRTFKGNGPNYGPLYVVLFNEWETYSSDPAYPAQLKSAYLKAVGGIHSVDDQARVGLGFGGYDWNPGTPVRDLSFWKDAIDASDFTSFQAMQNQSSVDASGQNVIIPEIEDAVAQLGTYGKPVIISNFKLWGDAGGASATFGDVMSKLLSNSEIRTLSSEGLFAWNFMSDHYVNDQGSAYNAVEPLIAKSAGPAVWPGSSGPVTPAQQGSVPDPTAGGWQLNGAARITNSSLLLNPARQSQAGSAFWPTPVGSSGLQVGFDATIGGGSGADGLTLTLAASNTDPTSIGSAGGGLGFAGINGVAVALDTYRNAINPSDNFVGLSGPVGDGGQLDWQATNSSVNNLRSTHHFEVAVHSGTLTVTMDGSAVLAKAVDLGTSVLVGFTGADGGLTDSPLGEQCEYHQQRELTPEALVLSN